jgi:hypothetical protein
MRQKRDSDRRSPRPARVARKERERFRPRMPRSDPPLKILGHEPRVRENRLENADVRLVEKSGEERGRSEPGYRDFLADGEKPKRLFELAVGHGPHGRRRARLAADIEEVVPEEILETAQRRMPRREGVFRERFAFGPRDPGGPPRVVPGHVSLSGWPPRGRGRGRPPLRRDPGRPRGRLPSRPPPRSPRRRRPRGQRPLRPAPASRVRSPPQ